MNTIGVYTQTTTAAGYKADLVKAFAKGVGQVANDNWRAELVPESKVRMSLAEQKSVVFGNDIKEGKGAVVKKTFSTADFTYENDCLFIKCSKIYRNIQDVRTAGETPTILIRADSNRNSKKLGIAGLRIIVNVENNRTRRALDLT